MNWTPDAILKLAPDSGVAKDGQKLAHASKWSGLGSTETAQGCSALWGQCQGSGKDPYKTQIDLRAPSEPAYRCSCPSRKFPCKHAVGLFLLLVTRPTPIPVAEPPAWVSDWLARRAQKLHAGDAQSAENPTTPIHSEAHAQRSSARGKKVEAGLEALDRWLRDLLRGGLTNVNLASWNAIAAQMQDAQAPDLRRRLLEAMPFMASPERLLEAIGKLHLLVQGYAHLDSLPPDVQADVRTLIGWTEKKETLLALPGVHDTWSLGGGVTDSRDHALWVERTWLLGHQTGRAALIIEYAYGQKPKSALHSAPPGITIDAEIIFYPSAYPLRALLKTQTPVVATSAPPVYSSAQSMLDAYGAALARNVWIERFPAAISGLTPVNAGEAWLLRDLHGDSLPLVVPPDVDQTLFPWQLFAASGGYPLTVFGEWDGQNLMPLSWW